MEDPAAQARTSRNTLERLGARIPGFKGYLERELRREVDQTLRAELASRLDRARARLLEAMRRLPLTAGELIGRLGAVDKGLDAVANQLRHAGSGYAGVFDAVKVHEAELEKLYRYDLALADAVDAVGQAVAALDGGPEAAGRLEAALAQARERVGGRDAAVRSAFAG